MMDRSTGKQSTRIGTSKKKKAESKEKKEESFDGDDIPLLDEVNALIEKEKTLLTLKLAEKQRDANEWKTKYDSLLQKISDGDFDHAEFTALEAAADLEVTFVLNLTYLLKILILN